MSDRGEFPANELWGNNYPKCPYCKTNIEPPENVCEGIASDECPECQKKFYTNTRFSVDYDTVGDCELNGQMPHQMKLTMDFVNEGRRVKQWTCVNCRAEWYDWQLQRVDKEKYVVVSDKVDSFL